jgi:nucleoside-diphosphate-sugar epimerase
MAERATLASFNEENQMNISTEKTALVLGATGGIGGEVARRLLARGWTVRALHRAPKQPGPDKDGLIWLRGDAMHEADVVRAAQGVALIVHAVNPPGYRNWRQLVLPMLGSSIAAARASGARLLLPGTVYNFGPDAFPTLNEDAPQRPVTRKGAIRVEMERRLHEAAEAGAIRVLIVRAGDFFGPRTGSSWFSQGLVKPGRPVRSVTYPGKAGTGHQWAYLPDVAETMVRLIEAQDRLAPFAAFNVRGHWDADGTQMVAALRRVLNRPDLKVKAFPWGLLPLIAPFVTVFRELAEMRYLWQQPLYLPNTRLLAVLGQEPHTPLDEAVRATLAGIGCLPGPAD